MRYHSISNELFKGNREKLLKMVKARSLVIIHSSDIPATSGDGVLPFRQSSNFFYLSGIDQEESILVLAPGFPDKKKEAILFVKETNEQVQTWEGRKLSKQEASDVSGVSEVMWSHQFDGILKAMLPEVDQVYLDFEENPRAGASFNHRNERFARRLRKKYPLLTLERLAPILTSQRMIKSEIEVDLIRKAGEITTIGYEGVLKTIKPGIWEFEIEAEFIHQFTRNRSKGFAYNPIIASGEDACILHYEKNDKQCQEGDLVLMDVAAEYANYKSDVTRTVPVSGKFSQRQKEVYQAVLQVKKKATDLLRPGKTLSAYNEEVGKLIEEALVGLGLLSRDDINNQDPKKPLYKEYYMHGTAHHLGLDVHDIASPYAKLKAGMVLTVEPGLYLKEEGIGIRLEDNIYIGKSGNINLTEQIPIEIEAIEEIMASI